MVVQHNLTAMNSNRMLNLTVKSQGKSTEKLSSGYRINRAADDAAGLSISEKMRKQIRGLTQAASNAQDGISAVQTAEGALNEVQDMLQRMNELAVKAANGTLSNDDRQYVQNEMDQLVTEINRVGETTKFNETYLLKGSYTLGPVSDFVGGLGENVTSEEMSNQILTTDTAARAKIAGTYAKNGYYTGATKGGAITAGIAGYIDFSAVKETDIQKLYGKGFSVTCGQCEKFMSVLFVDDSDPSEWIGNQSFQAATTPTTTAWETEGYAYGTNTAGGRTLYVNISDCTNGNDIVEKVMNAYADMNAGKDYETGYAYNMDANHHVFISANGASIGVFDSASPTTGGTKGYDATKAAEAVANGTTYSNYGALRSGVMGVGANGVILKNQKMNLHVGADATSNNQITFDLGNISDVALGLRNYEYDWKGGTVGWVSHYDVTTQKNAVATINYVADAIQIVSTMRSGFGAIQNRLEHTINNLDNVVENTTSAESAIRDTDMATEMVKYSNNNILAQAGQAMLAQSNQSNQGVLSLLQ